MEISHLAELIKLPHDLVLNKLSQVSILWFSSRGSVYLQYKLAQNMRDRTAGCTNASLNSDHAKEMIAPLRQRRAGRPCGIQHEA